MRASLGRNLGDTWVRMLNPDLLPEQMLGRMPLGLPVGLVESPGVAGTRMLRREDSGNATRTESRVSTGK